MPHFECGAFNHSATSPQFRGCASVAAQYLAVARSRHKGAGFAERWLPLLAPLPGSYTARNNFGESTEWQSGLSPRQWIYLRATGASSPPARTRLASFIRAAATSLTAITVFIPADRPAKAS